MMITAERAGARVARAAIARQHPPMPREHGAWGILFIPFATAVAVSGVFDLKVALLLVSILCFYIARASYLKHNIKWTAILLAGSILFALALIVKWSLWGLIGFGAVAAPLAFRQNGRSAIAQVIAVCGLTLTAPAAWYVATGQINAKALWLWLLNALYFVGGVFYVKMHIAAAARRKPLQSLREKAAIGGSTLLHSAGLSVCLAALIAGKAIPPVVCGAYLPGVARAIAGIGRLSPTLRIKRLGWTEVAYSIVFAAALIASLRWSNWGDG